MDFKDRVWDRTPAYLFLCYFLFNPFSSQLPNLVLDCLVLPNDHERGFFLKIGAHPPNEGPTHPTLQPLKKIPAHGH